MLMDFHVTATDITVFLLDGECPIEYFRKLATC